MAWKGSVRAQVLDEFRIAARRRYGVVERASDERAPVALVEIRTDYEETNDNAGHERMKGRRIIRCSAERGDGR